MRMGMPDADAEANDRQRQRRCLAPAHSLTSLALGLFTFFAASAAILGSVGYLALHAVLPGGRVFGALPRMFRYHDAQPFQYIGLVAVTYGIIATAVALRWPRLAARHRPAVIVGILVATVLVASVPGGVLWKLHDMQAGYFTMGAEFWGDLLWGAATGLQAGWLVLALSLPYNLIGLLLGYLVTHAGLRLSASAAESRAAPSGGGSSSRVH